jgi:thiol-disulfide isomerase/thioredoxin
LLLAAVALLLVGGSLLAIVTLPQPRSAAESAVAAPEMGALAPEISLRQLENGSPGPAVTLSALRGRPVVVNFWATWCQPCREEFPELDAVYRQHRETAGLQVIAVNIQDGSTPEQVQAFIGETGVLFPVWLTGAGDLSVERAYQIQAMPTTVFIDRAGIIRQIRIGGPLTRAYLEEQLKKIL